MPSSEDQLSEAFGLVETGLHRYEAGNVGDAAIRDVVYGGQLLGQMILAASRSIPDKEVKSIHTIFARGGTLTRPVELDVEPMHDGRTLASTTVTARQGDRLCARGLVLLHVDEPDLIRHGPDMPVVTGPDDSQDAASHGLAAPGTDVRIVGAVDTWDPASPVGPPELFVWLRLPGRPGGPGVAQALLSYATDGFLIGTAMRPHPGFGQNMAHRSVSTGVVSHTLTFHEPIETGRWLLVAHECPYAGRGRTYGHAHVFTEDGRLVASFVQENLVRGAAPGGSGGAAAPM